MGLLIFTDGGCRPNPGLGTYAYVILDESETVLHSFAGLFPDSTNNIMELSAVVSALSYCQIHFPGQEVTLVTDSQYVKNGITTWIKSWKARGWKTADRKLVKNQNLWFLLDKLTELVHVQFQWVKGHNVSKWNNYVDELCSALYKP